MYLLADGKVIKEYHVAFGENPKGHKEQEGDERTPEGTYTLDYKKEDSSFYRAMHISYPNAQDVKNAEYKGFLLAVLLWFTDNVIGLGGFLQLRKSIIGQMVA